MPKTLLCTTTDQKQFKVTVPDESTITFGPFSPPTKNGYSDGSAKGTIRVYQGSSKTNIIACFSGIISFRDLSLGYSEQIAKEEGAVIWKDDKDGYVREEKLNIKKDWIVDTSLIEGNVSRKRSNNF